MKIKLLPLLATLFFSSATLADQALLKVTIGVPRTVALKANTYIEFSAVTDVKLLNIKVNKGACYIKRMNDFWVKNFAEEIALYRKQMNAAMVDAFTTLEKEKSLTIFTRCDPEQINSLEITTNKGIQTIKLDVDAKPVISVKPLSENKYTQAKKADPSVLEKIYQVSNYSCYQTKDELEGIIELCSPLPADTVSNFQLPYGSLMSKPLFIERAKERARKARYIEYIETFPAEIPRFEAKRLPSVAIPSIGPRTQQDPTVKLENADNKLDHLIGSYENWIIELAKNKSQILELEAEIANDKKAAARIAKALKQNPNDGRLNDNAKSAENRILQNLSRLERLAVRIPEQEQNLAKKKMEIQNVKDEIIQLREIVKQHLGNNVLEKESESPVTAKKLNELDDLQPQVQEQQVEPKPKIQTQPQLASVEPQEALKIYSKDTEDTSEDIVVNVVKMPTSYIPPVEKSNALKFNEGMAYFQADNGLYGFVDQSGNVVITPKYKNAGGFYNRRAVVKTTDELWGYIDKQGNWIVQPQFCMAGRFSEGLAAVYVGGYKSGTECYGGKWGFITPSGKMVIEPQFDRAWYFSKDGKGVAKAKVEINGNTGYINSKGHWVN